MQITDTSAFMQMMGNSSGMNGMQGVQGSQKAGNMPPPPPPGMGGMGGMGGPGGPKGADPLSEYVNSIDSEDGTAIRKSLESLSVDGQEALKEALENFREEALTLS
ncbi:MAG TPA: hypothetical protein ENL02_03130, partial [Epsilonproteobacteria bacterium]|nr:hypothetical protein [Campylobacterota bacterium]